MWGIGFWVQDGGLNRFDEQNWSDGILEPQIYSRQIVPASNKFAVPVPRHTRLALAPQYRWSV